MSSDDRPMISVWEFDTRNGAMIFLSNGRDVYWHSPPCGLSPDPDAARNAYIRRAIDSLQTIVPAEMRFHAPLPDGATAIEANPSDGQPIEPVALTALDGRPVTGIGVGRFGIGWPGRPSPPVTKNQVLSRDESQPITVWEVESAHGAAFVLSDGHNVYWRSPSCKPSDPESTRNAFIQQAVDSLQSIDVVQWRFHGPLPSFAALLKVNPNNGQPIEPVTPPDNNPDTLIHASAAHRYPGCAPDPDPDSDADSGPGLG